MRGPIGQLNLGFGKSIFNFSEVPEVAPEDQFPVKIIDPQDLDVILYDAGLKKWTNRNRIILTDGGNF